MNKSELIAKVKDQAGFETKKEAEAAVKAVFEVIKDSLAAGEKVQIVGFGSFETKKRNARVGRNPKTKEEIKIPATRVAAFKAGKELKEAVAK